MGYLTVAKTHERTEEVKGSSFIAFVTSIDSLSDVEAHLQKIRSKHEDANHNCYAYKLGQQLKFSDDGEPGGTAGRPMLEVLQKRNLDHVLTVVTRYFGGTKLGAGGLVRAYSGALAKALDEAGVLEVRDRISLSFEVPFAVMDSVHRFADSVTGLKREELEYTASGMKLSVSMFAEDEMIFKKQIVELARGQVVWNGSSLRVRSD
ncbi:MAG: IMPACT family protein [Trueperaceae bacterium]